MGNERKCSQIFIGIKTTILLNTREDWNTITRSQVISNGGGTILKKYSMFELKCMACPEGKSIFDMKHQSGFWETKENVDKFLLKIKEKYNLNTPEDWNSITVNHIKSNGGRSLLKKYSMFELKRIAYPEGQSIFDVPPQPSGYWESQENIDTFLSQIKQKYNLNTPEDWNSITKNHINGNGGSRLFSKYSMFEIKCMACPGGKSIYYNSKLPSGYWENQENILQFLSKIKQKYNLNTAEDWNSITQKHIQANGGRPLLKKYSMFELKCMACPEGKSIFNNPKANRSPGYWKNQENIDRFLAKIKEKYNLSTPEDWKRISRHQITSQGGWGLINNKNIKVQVKFETENEPTKSIPLSTLISVPGRKRSSQRWLFLQIQKLFPGEEIVEDYFHSEISRISGSNVQFDIFMIERNIAIEYHGQQHYEDMPSGFSPLQLHQNRDIEKQKLCSEHGIQLIVIPYWWDNKLDSLRETLYSKIQL